MVERWSRDQVLAAAPDAASQLAAQRLAGDSAWISSGAMPELAVWGECKGSGKNPYRACCDLSGPAYRCTCPSRKFPCKHALALLLMWSQHDVSDVEEVPPWVGEWLDSRRTREEKAQARQADERAAGEASDQPDGQPDGGPAGQPDGGPAGQPDGGPAGQPGGQGSGEGAGRKGRSRAPADPEGARRRAEQRAARVGDGLAELDRWLCDQVRLGIAHAATAGYEHWDGVARRLVDAQAPGVARLLTEAAGIPGSGKGWAGELLTRYALTRLLVRAYQWVESLPGGLDAVVRRRIGFTISRESVLREGERVTDQWHVLGQYDEVEDGLTTRTVWLQGKATGRPAVVLAFAPVGYALDASFVTGSLVDADLMFYPGALSLRALVSEQRARQADAVPAGVTVAGLFAGYAAALEADPWLEGWPVVLAGVIPGLLDSQWHLVDGTGDSVPVVAQAQLSWQLIALSGGHPVVVAGEWTPAGLRPLTAWGPDGSAVML